LADIGMGLRPLFFAVPSSAPPGFRGWRTLIAGLATEFHHHREPAR